jgi:hypothetical protein
MRISDDRYSRDRERYDLALRFIDLEARTQTIRTWTGLSDDRIRKLYRSYSGSGRKIVTRHRGRSPRVTSFFVRSARMRQETALLVTMCYLYEVMPHGRLADPPRDLPGLRRGLALCQAFETYRRLIPSARISFEHAVFLVLALAVGEEIQSIRCEECSALTILDRCSPAVPRCLACDALPLHA